MGLTAPAAQGGPDSWERALGAGPVFWSWLVAVGVDLFLNAGILSPLFEQEREPGLLTDTALAARIPVAYAVVAVTVAALAWLLDTTDTVGARSGAKAGAAGGLLLTTVVVWLWTAIEMTLSFVGAAVVVQVSMLASAGAVLGAVRSGTARRTVRRRCAVAAITAAAAGVVAQNLVP